MWKKRHKNATAAAVCMAACLASPMGNAEGVSTPVQGEARHLLHGELVAPIVRWVDLPGTVSRGGTTSGNLGYLEITLTGSVTEAETRTLMLSSTCGTELREKELTFRYEGSPLVTPALGKIEKIALEFKGTPQIPDGWALSPGQTGPGSEGMTLVDYAGVNLWDKSHGSSGERVIVQVKTTEKMPDAPGYYTATYCVQQMVR
ncbi:TPA: hypothetical protein ACWV6Y_005405 [Salmonella enterica subsp. enterica serovar Muenchen]